MSRVRGGLICIALLMLALCCRRAQATDYALLIGVADYPALPQRMWLRGPINDVALMRSTLLARGFAPERLRTLVSRAGGPREPTLANIQRAMRELQAQVSKGDRVFLYFSGHGSQQPQPAQHGTRPTEPDGLDEVFLPADVERWDGRTGLAAIPNALLDDEIGEWMDAAVDRGAFVFAVFDTCHAGGMARGDGLRLRGLNATELGVPLPATRPWKGVSLSNRLDKRSLLFAARSYEAAAEEWLPRAAPAGSNRVQGVLTFHLAGLLGRQSRVDGEGLEKALLGDYRAEGRVSPSPVLLGDASTDWP